jgi:hypothetical protein
VKVICMCYCGNGRVIKEVLMKMLYLTMSFMMTSLLMKLKNS